jgi:pyrimidine deaminase RibD-like protein
MTSEDLVHMNTAISLAENCTPRAEKIPKVGAVIAIGKTVIGRGQRGHDDHAEKAALGKVDDLKQLPEATVYTTLEPCTKEVRSDPLKCCTELILQGGIKRVFIGILDPNQGVRGKGLWELQSRGIEVELFPPDLANRIRAMNHAFIRVQQTLGIEFTNIEPGQKLKTHNNDGVHEFQGTFLNPPGEDVFAFTGIGGKWWPQPHSLRVTGHETWAVKVHFGGYGLCTVCIVKTSDLGANLVNYYRKVCELNIERERHAREYFLQIKSDGSEILKMLKHKYPGIDMGSLPKGIEVQAMVEVEIEPPPATGLKIDQRS